MLESVGMRQEAVTGFETHSKPWCLQQRHDGMVEVVQGIIPASPDDLLEMT